MLKIRNGNKFLSLKWQAIVPQNCLWQKEIKWQAMVPQIHP